MSTKKDKTPVTRTAPRQMRIRARIAVFFVVFVLFVANVLRLGWLQMLQCQTNM